MQTVNMYCNWIAIRNSLKPNYLRTRRPYFLNGIAAVFSVIIASVSIRYTKFFVFFSDAMMSIFLKSRSSNTCNLFPCLDFNLFLRICLIIDNCTSLYVTPNDFHWIQFRVGINWKENPYSKFNNLRICSLFVQHFLVYVTCTVSGNLGTLLLSQLLGIETTTTEPPSGQMYVNSIRSGGTL